MIILDATTKTLEVLLSGVVTTNQLPIVASFVDILSSDQSISTLSETDAPTNDTTAVTVVAAPAAGHTRTLKTLSVYNKDTVAATVTVRYNNNGTMREVVKVALNVGDTLQYEDA